MVGERPGEVGQMLQEPGTMLLFPICWQACLVGSPCRFEKTTDKFEEPDMQTFRKKYRSYTQKFVVSPTKLDDITELSQPTGTGAAAAVP